MNNNMNQNNMMNNNNMNNGNMNNNMMGNNMNNSNMNNNMMNHMNNGMNNNMMNSLPNNMGNNPNMMNSNGNMPQNNGNGNRNSFSPNDIMNNKNKYLLFGGIGIAVLVVIVVVVIALSGKESDTTKNYPNDLNDLEKTEERLNKNYKITDFVLSDGNILVKFTNNNKECVSASFKVELYNSSKEVVGVEDGYIMYVPGKTTTYNDVYIPSSTSYDSYKVTSVTLMDTSSFKTHNKDIEILSKTVNDDYVITQFKNKSKDKIDDLELGVLYYDAKGKIIGFSASIETDVAAGSTMTTKSMIPYDNNYDSISYAKYEVVVLTAVTRPSSY